MVALKQLCHQSVFGLGLVIISSSGFAQRLVDWTQENSELGLGYPVPIPVDTALPFDGFRTYQGLHSRHQDFMLNTDVVAGQIINQTRQGRDIWAYQLSDSDSVTLEGMVESATMIQGGIHAREWQSPEVVTGIMERLVENKDDRFIHQYLLENTNMVILPVHNIDGLMQTQRFPRSNYLDSDINSPTSPRDGRMRRKNMLGVDEVLETTDDHLLGVDLNRNNPPFWASSDRSSADNRSLVHHGAGPHSEPETQAMAAAAADLGPADRLRIYTDVHSFSQVHFSVRTNNARRNSIQTQLLADFSNHHVQQPGSKFYFDVPGSAGVGIGSTDEFFAETYQIPSWTLEVEPSNGNPAFGGLPGFGGDYGGFSNNTHDGFILPESEIRRVRDNLSESFMIAYYHQAGPPALIAARVIDKTTNAVIYDQQWDFKQDQRLLHQQIIQPLQTNREYTVWLAFNKPMRWRDNDTAVVLPGQPSSSVDFPLLSRLDGQIISFETSNRRWLNQPSGSLESPLQYVFDSYAIDVSYPGTITTGGELELDVSTFDMVGQGLDTNPQTPVDWDDGHWVGYESNNGVEGDSGGRDNNTRFPLTTDTLEAPFVIRPGTSAAYFDPQFNGQGFLLEVLENNLAVVYWFTFDEQGNQQWYTGQGNIIGNVLEISNLFSARGTVFGSEFDPDDVQLENAGRLTFIFESCDTASLRFMQPGRTLRQSLTRLTSLSDLDCGVETPNQTASAGFSGTWFRADRSGEGLIVQIFSETSGLAFWFTYDDQGNPAWFFGNATLENDQLIVNNASLPTGGIFGDDFDPSQVLLNPWGEFTMSLSCEQAQVTYNSSISGFGSGLIDNLEPLTRLAGVSCN